MTNKKIASELAIGMILILALVLGGIFWMQNDKEVISQQPSINNDQFKVDQLGGNDLQKTVKENKDDTLCLQDVKECPDGSFVSRIAPKCDFAECSVSEINNTEWQNVQFDGCGKKDKYENLAWWSDFASQVSQYKYYTKDYIESALTSDPNTKYTYEEYCSKTPYHIICDQDNLNKKVSIDNFAQSGEGCLSKDGTKFVAVLGGEYMGGGNYVFRYDVGNKKLEEAKRMNQDNELGFWNNPPTSFGKRIGNIIKMTGNMGDGGCGARTKYDFNIFENTLRVTENCFSCDGEREQCKTY